MSELCVISKCKSKSLSVCYCCNKNLCFDHLNEHNELNKSELNILNNEIISLIDQLKLFDKDKLIKTSREKLDKWKINSYEIIDNYYEEKCHELEQFYFQKFDQHQKEIDEIQTTIMNLICNEKSTQKNLELLKSTVDDLKNEINKIKEKGIEMDIHPFILDNHWISIKDSKPNEFNVNKSILSSPYHTIESTDGYQSEFTCNNRFILITLGNHLCLFNRDLNLIKQCLWSLDPIYDMCWSSTLSNFIIITEKKKVYRINEITLSIERIYGIEEKDWLCCTCSQTYLYLTTRETGTNIYQFKLLPLIRPVKQWQSPYSCQLNESIHNIKYNLNNDTIALVIRQSLGGVIQIELRSTTTFNRLWSLPLDITTPGIWSRINSCSLQYDQWLLIHPTTSRLFHITKDGKLKIIHEYYGKLNNIIMFGSNIFVGHLGTKINFHKL